MANTASVEDIFGDEPEVLEPEVMDDTVTTTENLPDIQGRYPEMEAQLKAKLLSDFESARSLANQISNLSTEKVRSLEVAKSRLEEQLDDNRELLRGLGIHD